MLFIKCIEGWVLWLLFTLGADIFESKFGVIEEFWTFRVENPTSAAWCLSHPVHLAWSHDNHEPLSITAIVVMKDLI